MKFILIVGPSGAGKDSLLDKCREALANRPCIVFLPRYVTRMPDSNEQNYYLDQRAFDILKQNGFFLADWQAHGNSYGINVDPELRTDLGAAIVSISRTAIPVFEATYRDVHTILVTASPDLLRRRLEKRGRETAGGMDSRLARMGQGVRAGKLTIFDNSGPLEQTTARFLELLEKIVPAPAIAPTRSKREFALSDRNDKKPCQGDL